MAFLFIGFVVDVAVFVVVFLRMLLKNVLNTCCMLFLPKVNVNLEPADGESAPNPVAKRKVSRK